MTTGPAFVRGASYVLGERERDHTAIANLNELACRFRMAPNAGLWGWGHIRTTARALEELAVDTGIATLRAAGLRASSVDALVLCSNRIPGPAEGHGQFVANVLTGIGLDDIPCYGQNLNRCVNMLAGLDVAQAFVASGRYRQVLVITTDRVAAGADRMSQFALFSDGAASCIVAAEPGSGGGNGNGGNGGEGGDGHRGSGGAPGDDGVRGDHDASYELLGCATAQDTATLEWTKEISSDLARQVNDRLLTPSGLRLRDITGLMHANLFKPLVVMKERQAGFSADQLYLDNVTRIGHCFAADPLINLVDRAALGHVGEGHYFLLASSVPGSRIGALLKRVR
jgi:3-oxoacyl-[acyl-carrier-protein] synthase III